MSESKAVRYDIDGEIAVLTIDRPPVNAINAAVREGLIEGIARAGADALAKAVVVRSAGRMLSSGADLRELSSEIEKPAYSEAFGALEHSVKPVIIVISGLTLGAGLELALAAHYRCAIAGARMGFPEITLGIVPGAGATQRLPRIIGARPALEMLIEGSPITAEQAKLSGSLTKSSQTARTKPFLAMPTNSSLRVRKRAQHSRRMWPIRTASTTPRSQSILRRRQKPWPAVPRSTACWRR
jgi:enoyl-CoA hydratase/carnithine racemase